MKRTIIEVGAVFTLILAGAIHTFPFFWLQWEKLVTENPKVHFIIGLTALSLGICKLVYLYKDIINNRIPK